MKQMKIYDLVSPLQPENHIAIPAIYRMIVQALHAYNYTGIDYYN